MRSRFRILLRKIRWCLGFGWAASEFETRYRRSIPDAWGYENSEAHQNRFDSLLRILPDQVFDTAIELGCAEGHFTEKLARRCKRVIACDLSQRALARARKRLPGLAVDWRQCDIRAGIPAEDPDLLIFSDVLYYLSPKEISEVIRDCSRKTRPGALLVFANEWSHHYRMMTPAERIRELIQSHASWNEIDSLSYTTSPNDGKLILALYERNHQP